MSGKSSKNNPDARGKATVLRKYKGKTVKPVRIINRAQRINFIGAAYETGEIVVDANTKRPIPYKQIYG
jgi:ribosomal protein L27